MMRVMRVIMLRTEKFCTTMLELSDRWFGDDVLVFL